MLISIPKSIWLVLCFTSLLIDLSLSTINYEMTWQCQSSSDSNCKSWKKNMNLFHKKNWVSTPVHASQKVLTSNGPKTIDQLKVGDQILGFNHDKGINEFSPLLTWLHKDEQAEMDFIRIKTEDGTTFITSSDSNLAVYTPENGTLYKMINELIKQELVLFGKTLKLKSVQEGVRKKGLYAPITESGNFYIFSENSDQESPMILINCYANIDEPDQKHSWIKPILKIVNKFVGPEEEVEYYEHPISYLTEYMQQIPTEYTRANVVNEYQQHRQQQRLQAIQVVMMYLRQMQSLIMFIN